MMQVKYIVEFNSIKYGINYLLNILEDNYQLEPITLNVGASSVVLQRDADNIFRGTSLNMSLEVPEEFPWGLTDLFSTHAKQNLVELYTVSNNNQQLLWTGYIIPEQYSDPLISPPFDIQTIAVDGLGTLKDIDFDIDPSLNPLPLIDIIAHCLQKLSLNLPIAVALNIWEQSFNTAFSSLAQTSIKPSAFYSQTEPFKMDKVLALILQSFDVDVTITQANGRWEITRQIDCESPMMIYSATGQYVSTENASPLVELASHKYYSYGKCFPIGNLTREIVAQPRQIEINQDYGQLGNILQWGYAVNDSGVKSGNFLMSTVWRTATGFNVRMRHESEQSYWSFGASATYYPDPKYVQKVFTTTKYTKLVLKMAGNGAEQTIGLRVKLEGDTNKWLTTSGWVTSSSLININVEAELRSFKDYTIIIDSFPNDGFLSFEIVTETGDSVSLSEIKLEMYPTDSELYPSSITSYHNIEPNAIRTENFDVYGSANFDDNTSIFFKNTFLKAANGRPTTLWKMNTDINYSSMLSIMARSIASNNRQTLMRVSGTLMGESLSLSKKINYPSASAKFIIQSGSHDLRYDELSVTMLQYLNFYDTEPDVTDKPLYSNTSSGVVSVNQNADYATFGNGIGIGKRIPQLPTASTTANKFLMIDGEGSTEAEKVPYIQPFSASDFAAMFELSGTAPNQYLLAKFPFASSGYIKAIAQLLLTAVGGFDGIIADDGAGSTIFSLTRQASNEIRLQGFGDISFFNGSSEGTERTRITTNNELKHRGEFHFCTTAGALMWKLKYNADNGDLEFFNADNAKKLCITQAGALHTKDDIVIFSTR